MEYSSNNIRNILVLGHQGSGKTTLTESLFSIANGNEKGSVEKRNTISDFTKEEQNRLSSCQLSIVPIFYKDYKLNLIDIPGNDDFIYEALGVLQIAKGAILVIDATKKVEVETIKHYRLLRKHGIPTIIYVNKMDKENIVYDEILEDILEKLDKKGPISFVYPMGHEDQFDGFVNVITMKARKYNGKTCEDDEIYPDKKQKVISLHTKIEEQVALTDDKYLDKYFSGETLTMEEIHKGLHFGVLSGQLTPVICGCATKNIGLHTMLEMLIDYLPSSNDLKPYSGYDDKENLVQRYTNPDDPLSAYVFKTYFDPFKGVVHMIKVLSGTLNSGDEVLIPRLDSTIKLNNLVSVCGNTYTSIDKVLAGDIVGIAKCDELKTGDTISLKNNYFVMPKAKYPTAVYFKAIEFKDSKEEEKIMNGIAKLQIENPCLEVKRNPETKQLLIGGLSDSYLNFIKERMQNLFNVNLNLSNPKIVYRETIRDKAEAEGRYVKQSGGSGFYGVVVMRFEPSENNTFTEEIFGGSVPKNYIPAVEKGFYEGLQSGGLAGFPVLGVKATLLDGKYHSVDSNDLSFKMAAQLAFKAAYPKCKPTILEPIMKVLINVDNEYTGNILNDLNQRRARVLSIDEKPESQQQITALVPEAEILDYVSKLRVLTHGSGFFNREFSSYQQVPEHMVDKIIQENSLLKK
ncbi:MAG: elongation factor G [Bacillales bacterium]